MWKNHLGTSTTTSRSPIPPASQPLSHQTATICDFLFELRSNIYSNNLLYCVIVGDSSSMRRIKYFAVDHIHSQYSMVRGGHVQTGSVGGV